MEEVIGLIRLAGWTILTDGDLDSTSSVKIGRRESRNSSITSMGKFVVPRCIFSMGWPRCDEPGAMAMMPPS
jgi:hypothetical protein